MLVRFKSSSGIFLFASLVFHAGVILLLNTRRPKEDVRPKQSLAMEVEIVSSKISRGNIKGGEAKPSKTHTSKQTNLTKQNLSKFSPKVDWTPDGYKKRTFQGTQKGERSDDPNEEFGLGGKDLKRMTHPGLMNMVYNRVNGLTFYPGVLARRNISGVVYARLILNRKGECDWGKIWIRSRERHFRIYILSVLKKACRQNYANQMKKAHQVNVDLTFDFAITEHPGWDEQQDYNFNMGNSLLFYRNVQKSKWEWNFGPFKGLFPAPVVNVDFQWLQENWEKYVEGLEDPVMRFENEKKKDVETL